MSGIQGFPSIKKNDLGTGRTNGFTTVIPTDPYRNALDAPRFAFRVNSDSVPRVAGPNTGTIKVEGSLQFWVDDPATPAMRGDLVRFEDGAALNIEFPIIAVEADRFLISCVPDSPPAPGDEFYILRHTTQRVAEDGSPLVVVTPVAYLPVEKALLNTSVTPITTAAFTEIISATAGAIKEIEIFNKTGSILILGVGPASGEEELIYIGSDGLSRQTVPIPAGSRVALKAVQADVQDGLVLLNAFG